jgi:hypothetical protein
MSEFIIWLLGLGAFALLGWFVWRVLILLWALIVAIFASGEGGDDTVTGAGNHPDGMNEGDFHSGPEGYEPNTAYPETYYGEYGRDE